MSEQDQHVPTTPLDVEVLLHDHLPKLDLESYMDFTEDDDCVIIKITRFLGSSEWARIHELVNGWGGGYDKDGRRWTIPKPKMSEEEIEELGFTRARETLTQPPQPQKEPLKNNSPFEVVPIDALVESPFQFRSTYDEKKIEELKDSVKQVGVLQPLVVRENSVGALEIVAGHRRFKASRKADLKEIPVIKRKLTDEEAVFTQLMENIQREDVSDYDIGKALCKLNRKGWNQEQLGKKLGITQQQVSNYIDHYRFCENNITTAVVNVDMSELTEYSTRLLRKLENQNRIKEKIKTLDIKPKSKITLQELKAIYKDIYHEIPEQLSKDVKDFLSEHPTLYSLLSYPTRGPFGSGNFPGNASGWLLVELIQHFKPETVFDPMEGSHTSRHVCQALGLTYFGNDLKNEDGFDLVDCSLEKIPPNDLTYFHPPYWNIIKYSDHPNDLSNQPSYELYLEKLCTCIDKLLQNTKLLAILLGDIWKGGNRFIAFDLYSYYKPRLFQRLIKAQHSVSSGFADKSIKEKDPFYIPIRHEDVLLLKGDLF